MDLHAEATSEKVAMGWHLDGQVSAVVGTHTHVRTGDAQVLPGGTAYITDAGMCGPRDSVIGVKKELVLERFLTQLPVRFEVADGNVWLEGVVIELGTMATPCASNLSKSRPSVRTAAPRPTPRCQAVCHRRRGGAATALAGRRRSVRSPRPSLLVRHAETLLRVLRFFQLVDHGHGIVG